VTPFRFVPHTADVAAVLEAHDEDGLRRAGVGALRELLVGSSRVDSREQRAVPLRGGDPAERLVHFLQDVLYLYDVERFVPAGLTPVGIEGEIFDPGRHETRPEVKAVTHHDVEIHREPEGLLRVTIVFDV
jgi:SHS2 domain-containing protein